MPPQVFNSSIIRLSPPISSKLNNKREPKRIFMKITKIKIIPFLVFILSIISVFRFLKISVVTTTSHPPPSSTTLKDNPSENSILTNKELNLLSNLISNKSPCNLLFFGLEPEYINMSLINKAGINYFLDDHPSKMEKLNTSSINALFYKVEYERAAREAFELLKYARESPDCRPGGWNKCKLAMRRLPEAVMEKNWDIVVVDGPDGDREDAPGRMEAIYTAGLIARSGKKEKGQSTDILIHDKDRMIEKWFAWEFLCDDNLVSTKGKFWHFRIIAQHQHSNSTMFCS
ncbi:glucuronoxylan 4-O-methyltransferase 1 [Impatiens glandulifera]|uniref:glucuronoxylan 4-O-methyltransferase 1 n=1 Tax=Impatiens glandulifera TaxID=253017 RepID=UPI001FB1544A|nr:glucuronoxylan 4-O-methyltransferase 1 [Impatiens glandulifera]